MHDRFDFKGVEGDDVRTLIESGVGDLEVLRWFNAHGMPKTEGEIKAWSDKVEASSSYNDPQKREWFVGECKNVGLDPKTASLFDYLAADDKQSFQKA